MSDDTIRRIDEDLPAFEEASRQLELALATGMPADAVAFGSILANHVELLRQMELRNGVLRDRIDILGRRGKVEDTASSMAPLQQAHEKLVPMLAQGSQLGARGRLRYLELQTLSLSIEELRRLRSTWSRRAEAARDKGFSDLELHAMACKSICESALEKLLATEDD